MGSEPTPPRSPVHPMVIWHLTFDIPLQNGIGGAEGSHVRSPMRRTIAPNHILNARICWFDAPDGGCIIW